MLFPRADTVTNDRDSSEDCATAYSGQQSAPSIITLSTPGGSALALGSDTHIHPLTCTTPACAPSPLMGQHTTLSMLALALCLIGCHML